jgi:hypothetical protein
MWREKRDVDFTRCDFVNISLGPGSVNPNKGSGSYRSIFFCGLFSNIDTLIDSLTYVLFVKVKLNQEWASTIEIYVKHCMSQLK